MELLYKDIDEPGPQHARGLRERGGYKMLRKALKMEPQEVLEEMLASDVRGRGGAGFAMGKKMSFIPKGRWTSTSSATPTSPSPAPSRTAS